MDTLIVWFAFVGAMLFALAILGVVAYLILSMFPNRDRVSAYYPLALLGPLGQALLGLILTRNEAQSALRCCPHCAELIQPTAKVCRYCGRDITP